MSKQSLKSNNQRRSSRRFRRSSFGDSFGFSYSDFEFPCRRHGFTILELLVVIAIIITLAGLILATTGYVQKKGARSRAEAEIAAMSAALESYKADNGIYPATTNTNSLNAQTTTNPSASSYQTASFDLYSALTGDTNGDRTVGAGDTNPSAKSYFSFKPNQLSPTDQSQKVQFIRDPFGNSYGYSTSQATTQAGGYNPTFDLWSTAGGTGTGDVPGWIKNW
jgi:prepilin-type N-terminal cleavage/methylation domain-containing protein